jgi:DNA-binding beta-propeller fold protein YncE
VFKADASGTTFLPLRSWDISAWYGQSLDNKPFLAADSSGYIYAVDPDGARVLQFNTEGKFLRGWSELIGDSISLVMPAGLAVDPQGGLWVSDASANRLLHFNLPLAPLLPELQPSSPGQFQIGPQELSPTNAR